MTPPSAQRGWLAFRQFAAITAAGTDAFRLFSGADGWVERLGADALISYQTPGARDELMAGLQAWTAVNDWMPQRIFGRLLPRHNADRDVPGLLSGDPSLPLTTVVREAGVNFGIDFGAGYSAGLFPDQRANRAHLRRCAPRRLLNTFAYTCSFSTVAALAGAETLSVDLSRKSLDRGRGNFTLNGLDPERGHRFLADDVLEVLPRLARRGEKFDAIVLDPPTFSRGNKGRRWQVEQDFEDLLAAALEVATRDARILLSTNCAKLAPGILERMGRHVLKLTRRTGEFQRQPQPPDFPPGHGARTLWLSLRS